MILFLLVHHANLEIRLKLFTPLLNSIALIYNIIITFRDIEN